MKEAIYKLFTLAFTVLIFWGILHSMSLLAHISDYSYTKKAAEKNSGLAELLYDIPAVSAKAPPEAMRTEPAPLTAEDLSYFYLDGIKFEFPCTLADIREHFETRRFSASYDENKIEYSGTEIILKNGMGFYRVNFTADTRESSPEECVVKSITTKSAFDSYGKYIPQYVAAGIDVVNTTEEEFYHLTAFDENEYLTTYLVVFPYGDDGYTVFNIYEQRLSYYKKDDPKEMQELERMHPALIKTELRLPEDYDTQSVPESKAELTEFTQKHYGFDRDDNATEYIGIYYKLLLEMVNGTFMTAYEFLALDNPEEQPLYYELTDIEVLRTYDLDEDGYHSYYDTDYLKVTAICYFECPDAGYENVEMILKPGDRLGDALIIYMG